MYLIFDTETTGLPNSFKAPVDELENWPRLVQLAWQVHEEDGSLIAARNYIVKPEGFTIPFNSVKVHGISTERAEEEGYQLNEVLEAFLKDLNNSEYLIAHNISFDEKILGAEFIRAEYDADLILKANQICTGKGTANFCQLPGGKGKNYKMPKLNELHQVLFGEGFEEAHNAAADVEATARCFLEALRRDVFYISNDKITEEKIKELKTKTEDIVQPTVEKKDGKEEDKDTTQKSNKKVNIKEPFSHLHCHSQFSILQGTTSIKDLVGKAKVLEMPAITLTDHGNMFGGFNFIKEASDNGIKPILGCEFYITKDRHKKKFTKDNKDKRNLQVFLAKNKKGYFNLSKLSTLGYVEGFYAIYPRIDKELVQEYKDDLIALTGGLKGEIPDLILNEGEHEAEKAFKWWHDLFGDDFYVELNRHGLEEEEHVNKILMNFAEKYG
ncbi:MAG: PHP domain-containing protein, partial [Flavobacteriales bacterium]